MTTFTTEDREYFSQNPWPNPWASPIKDYRQVEIPFFWPLTEQIPLDLDFGPSDLLAECYKAPTLSLTGSTGSYFLTPPNWGVTNIAPQLSVQPINSVGHLNIGGITVGLENKPKWYQKVLYKLLGFNWKDLK